MPLILPSTAEKPVEMPGRVLPPEAVSSARRSMTPWSTTLTVSMPWPARPRRMA